MQTQSTIIREYANGLADGFLNDLILAGERKLGPVLDGENDLIAAFLTYASETWEGKYPLALFKKRRK